MNNFNEKRLGKIIALAKGGIGGEKETAIKMVKTICKKYSLDFDEVMGAGDTMAEHWLHFKRGEKKIAIQVVCRYALTEKEQNILGNSKTIRFKCTQEKYIETLNAFEVLAPLFKKELKKIRKSIYFGFLQKHDLYPQFRRETSVPKKEETPEEMRARFVGAKLAEDMEDAKIIKRLSPAK